MKKPNTPNYVQDKQQEKWQAVLLDECGCWSREEDGWDGADV